MCWVEGVGSVLSFSAQPDSSHGSFCMHPFGSTSYCCRSYGLDLPTYILDHHGHAWKSLASQIDTILSLTRVTKSYLSALGTTQMRSYIIKH